MARWKPYIGSRDSGTERQANDDKRVYEQIPVALKTPDVGAQEPS